MIKLRYLIAHKLPLFNSKLYHLMAQIILLFQCRDTVVNISLSVTNAYMESISSPGDSTKVERFYVTKKVNPISPPQHRMKVEILISYSLTLSHIFCTFLLLKALCVITGNTFTDARMEFNSFPEIRMKVERLVSHSLVLSYIVYISFDGIPNY